MKIQNILKLCIASILGIMVVVTLTSSVSADDSNDNLLYINGNYQVMKRLYNYSTGEHRYVSYKSSVQEKLKQGWTLEKGSLLIDNKESESDNSIKVHCIINNVTKSSLYTVNDNEKTFLLNQNSKNPKSIPNWSVSISDSFQTVQPDQGIPVYRLYNPNSWRGSHHFTPIQAEKELLVRLGWHYEGVGFYVSGVLNK